MYTISCTSQNDQSKNWFCMSKKVIRFVNYNSRNDPENYSRETDAVPTFHGERNCTILLANKQRTVIILNAKTLIELNMEEYEPNRTCNHFKTFE